MADKTIGDLHVAEELYDDSLLVVEQNGEARSIKGSLVAKFAREATEGYATQAAESARQAAASQEAAAQSATAAEKSKKQAEVAAQNAANEVKETLAGYVSDAEAARDAAAGSATKAGEEAGKAEVAAKQAADDVRDELQDIADAAAASRDAAAQSEENAGASASKAEEQATKAETAAKNAADDVRAELQDISDATAASADAAAGSAAKAEEEAGKAEAAAGKAVEDVRDELQSLVDDATASKTAAGESAAAAKESEDAAAGYLAAAEKAKSDAQTAQTGAEDAAAQAEAAAGKAADDVRAELQDISDTTKGYKDAAASSATAAAGSSLAAEKSAETAKQYSGNPPKPDTDKNLWQTWDADTGEYKDTDAPVFTLLQFSYPSIEAMQADFENRQFGSLGIIASDVEQEDNARLYIRDKTAWKYLGDLSGVTGNGIKTWTKTGGDGSPGSSDTYTVTFTDGRTFVYTVYNGRDGEGTGDMLEAIYDPTGKRTDVFSYIDKAIANVQAQLTFDDTPTEGSKNPVTSDGIFKALQSAGTGGIVILRDNSADVNYALTVEAGRLTLTEIADGFAPEKGPTLIDTSDGAIYTLYVDSGRLGIKEV